MVTKRVDGGSFFWGILWDFKFLIMFVLFCLILLAFYGDLIVIPSEIRFNVPTIAVFFAVIIFLAVIVLAVVSSWIEWFSSKKEIQEGRAKPNFEF